MVEFLSTPFGTGFASGLVLTLLLGFLFFRLNIWFKSISSFFKPQVVTTTTKKSPFGVFMVAVGQTILFTALTLLVLSILYIHYFR
jgi:hypothetical protein